MKVHIPAKKKSVIVILSLLLTIGILIFTFIAGVKIMGFFPLSKSQQKEKVRKIFLDMGIDTCSVGNVTFSSFSSISLHDVFLAERIDHVKKITCKLSRIDIHYHPITTLLKWNTCRKILENKIDDILYVNSTEENNTTVFDYKKYKGKFLPLIYSEITGCDTLLFSCIRAVGFNSGVILIDSSDSQILHLQNISAAVNTEKNVPENREIEIKIDIEQVSLYKNSISNLNSTFNINGAECNTTFKGDSIFNGTLRGNFLFDLNKNQILRGKIYLDSINLEKIYTFYNYTKGSLHGTGSIHFDLDSSIADFSLLSGTGTIDAIDVNARKLPILNQIAELTMLSGLSDLNFENIHGDFTFRGDTIQSKNLTGTGDPLSVDLSGWIKPESRSFSINLKGTFQSYYKDSISSLVWETMFPEENNGRSFQCTIYGTQDSPSISIDKNFATRAINNVIRTLGDELKSFFK